MNIQKMMFLLMFGVFICFASYSSFAQDTREYGRFQVKNLKVKSYYRSDQDQLVRWVDDELLKIDTETGRVWRWVSERSPDRKGLREYWQELTESSIPISEGAR